MNLNEQSIFMDVLEKHAMRIYSIEQHYLFSKENMNLRLRYNFEHKKHKEEFVLTLKKRLKEDYKTIEIENSITKEEFLALCSDAEKSLCKKRYKIHFPEDSYNIDVDIFENGFIMAEIETFEDINENIPDFIKYFGAYCVRNEDTRYFNESMVDKVKKDVNEMYDIVEAEKEYFNNENTSYTNMLLSIDLLSNQ